MKSNTFAGALRDIGAAKECLRIALSPNLKDSYKAENIVKVLKATPGCARFDETKAAVWLLS